MRRLITSTIFVEISLLLNQENDFFGSDEALKAIVQLCSFKRDNQWHVESSITGRRSSSNTQ